MAKESPNSVGPTLLLILSLLIFYPGIRVNAQDSKPHMDHSAFDQLLKSYVDDEGFIDYAGLRKERKKLQNYLATLGRIFPDSSWSNNEKIAYWINLYNAFTTELVLQYYPLESIKQIGREIPLFYGDDPWDIEFIQVGSTLYNLDRIEHEVLREQFHDSRVHYALVCAASSCPNLRREVYTGDGLDAQLNNQAIQFINDPRKNTIGADEIKVSEIYDWYSDEFFAEQNLIEYINQLSGYVLDKDIKVTYIPFDWSLNDSKR